MNDTSSFTSYDVKEEENSENPKISEEIEEIKKILKNNFGNFQEVKIFCKTCKKTPIMRFDNFYKVNVSCTCGEKSFYMEEAFDKLFYDNSQNNLNKDLSLNSINLSINEKENKSYFLCTKHGKKFKFYCKMHEENLCDYCKNFHKCKEKDANNFEVFERLQPKLLGAINYILMCFKLRNLEYIENPNDFNIKELNDDFIDKKDIKNLISILIFEYFSTPNYRIIENINNFKNFLESKNKIEIHHETEYEENKNNLNKIIKIIIPPFPASNFNIDILKDDLPNLEEMNLKNNNIKSIKALGKIKLPKLKNLNLTLNFLKDDDIEIIRNLNFPNLEDLYLSNNNFTDYAIFEAIEHFKNLKIFNISSNAFKFREKDEYKVEYNFETLEKFYLSNGVLSEENIIKVLEKFKFKNLITLDLSSNNLRTLNFYKLFEGLPLENLFLNNNEIEDSELIEKLLSIKSLKNIGIQFNLIKDHIYIKRAIEKNKKLDILGNNINLTGLLSMINVIDSELTDAFKKSCKELKKRYEDNIS